MGPFMISHRGAAAFAPENTLAGVAEAIRQGARFVEVDVQRSADGVLVLIHDSTVDRTTDGTGEVGQLTWGEMQGLDAGSHFSPGFAGEPIPTLESLLESTAGRDVILILEAKDPQRYPGIERQLAEMLRRFKAQERAIVISFDHGWLCRFYDVAPEVPLGGLWVWMGSLRYLPPLRLVDVHWASAIADPTLVSRAHRRGYEVVVWTVNSAWRMKLLLWLGVDGITTDRPNLWSQVVGSPEGSR